MCTFVKSKITDYVISNQNHEKQDYEHFCYFCDYFLANQTNRELFSVLFFLNAAVNDIYSAVKDKEDKMDSMDWFEVQRNLKVRINDLNRMVKPGLIEKYNYIEDVEPRILLKTGYKESSDQKRLLLEIFISLIHQTFTLQLFSENTLIPR